MQTTIFFFYHLGIADFGEKPNIIIDSSRASGRAKYLERFFPVSQFVLSCLLNCHSWHGWLSGGMYSGMHSEGMRLAILTSFGGYLAKSDRTHCTLVYSLQR